MLWIYSRKVGYFEKLTSQVWRSPPASSSPRPSFHLRGSKAAHPLLLGRETALISHGTRVSAPSTVDFTVAPGAWLERQAGGMTCGRPSRLTGVPHQCQRLCGSCLSAYPRVQSWLSLSCARNQTQDTRNGAEIWAGCQRGQGTPGGPLPATVAT